jgi:hypothetical protein
VGERGCSDLGESRVQLRQLQAPHRSRAGRFTGFSLPKELLSRTVVIWAIHGSPAVVRVLQHYPGIWTYVELTEPSRGRFNYSEISPVELPIKENVRVHVSPPQTA